MMLPSLRFIPNALCFLRMLLVIPVAWLLFEHEFRATLWLFAVAAATDGLDGFLAKRCGWTSELGKIIDPLADKILLVGVFLTLAIMGLIPLWLAIAAIGRDVIITAGAITYNSLFGDLQGHPTWISKLNTLCQILFLLLIVAAHAVGDVPQTAVTILGALVFVTTVVSGIDYVVTYSRKAIAVSRRRRGLPA
ncbi:MAG TPA: CDP-alcohol phosphatidyltransferase family protein [Povalibacter sp.]|uniref:CDP-alcohol phosphatidyltransferase family protein n=1 Tax=Povalibacter sp. TaxID=1962978 RepID=UPI002C03C8D6|nr:CDP-alcohol phosphatidyltransferase family protein [Povalibacter sp.]HMN43468.1 CDP-alcohol phosphatidyltransferase family protein [Povalibacter sp.]